MYQCIYTDKKSETVHLWDDVNGYTRFPYKSYAYRVQSGGKYRSIYGHQLEKVTKFHPADSRLFESDVSWDTRVLIDVYGDSDEVSKQHRTLILDIEVRTKGGYPDIEKANQPITSIAQYDTVTKKYICWILDEDRIVEPMETDDTSIIPCHSEDVLLSKFLDKWEDITPTICVGWNSNQFDLPYLFNRISYVLGEDDALRLSPIKVAFYNKYKDQMTIAGVNCLDYLLLYKWYSGKKLPNYRLDTVAQEELKIGKVEYEGSLDDLMRNDIKKFIEYNIHDVRLVLKIDDKMQFIALAMDICHVCHVGYEEYHVSSRFLEGAVLTYLRRNHLVAPNKDLSTSRRSSDNSDDDEEEEGYEGAYVKPPVPGLYKWVASADINSLYPSTIMSLNISPETKVGKVHDWDIEKFARGEIANVTLDGYDFTKDEFLKFIQEKNYAIACNGVIYDQNKVGCIPDILKKWFAERVEYKKLMKKASDEKNKPEEVFWKRRQQVQKILLNSLYGVLGMPGWRWYDKDNAEAVTLTGQEIIKTSAKFVNARYNKRCGTTDKDYVIYIDTDSLYLDLQSLIDHEKATDPKAFCVKTISETAEAINKFYDVMMVRLFNATAHRIRIADDVVASSVFWTAKKRYAMRKVYNMELNKDVNDIEVKGLDVVRSSFPKRFQKLMMGVLTGILDGEDKATLDKKILKFKSEMSSFPIEEVAKNTSVRFTSKTEPPIDFNPKGREPFKFIPKSTAQCKAALAYNDILKKFNLADTEPIMSGGKIKWVYLRTNPFGLSGLAFKDDGKDPEFIMNFIGEYVDRSKIWEAELQSKLSDFYDALNWTLFSVDAEKIDEFFAF